MARPVHTLLIAMAAALLAAGCNNKANVSGDAAFPPPGGAAVGDNDLAKLPADDAGGAFGPSAGQPGGPYDVVQPLPPGPVPYQIAPEPAPLPPEPAVRYHIVQPKENYYRIAIKYYGSGSRANQQKLIDANPQYPPTQIPTGVQIVVPE